MSSFNLDNYTSDPGVYLMKNKAGKVIYVGKAKNLQKRIKQYFHAGRDERPMVPFLVAEVEQIDVIVVPTEKEALLLENTLIKRHQPKYNALLKDDKTFISLMINHKNPWPMIKLIRTQGAPKKDGLYFGPYTSAYAARQTFELMTKIFPLRQCSDQELKRRTRPCLLYGIKRCIAPCVDKCTKAEYLAYVDKAIDFLRGSDKKIVKELYQEMETASENLEYERASALLTTIRQIEHVIQGGGVVARITGKSIDAIALHRQGYEVMIVQLFFREGKLIGSEHYSFSDVMENDEELLSSFILQYYKDRPELPAEILLQSPLSPVAEIIGIPILNPKKGDKKTIIDMAEKNAKALFKQEKDENDLTEKMLLDLQETLKLNRFPERIECFDTSNISGTDLVASMIAFSHGKYDKKRGRLYKIRDIDKGDDYGALRQAIERRLIRAKAENDLPDLLIVDGGKGQLGCALQIVKALDIATIDVISVAKQQGKHDKGMTQEQVFVPDRSDPILLSLHSPILFLLQRIRDEAHRRAIGFHRERRSKRTISSMIDEIPGIGPIKRKRLLAHFGSLQRVFEASEPALLSVKGITRKDVEAIHAFISQKK